MDAKKNTLRSLLRCQKEDSNSTCCEESWPEGMAPQFSCCRLGIWIMWVTFIIPSASISTCTSGSHKWNLGRPHSWQSSANTAQTMH